jgi:hypothetical protein
MTSLKITALYLLFFSILFLKGMKTMKYSIKYPVFIILAGLFYGCASSPQLSPMQIRQITTRMIEGSYDTVFRATMTTLQDQGYIIKNTDMNSGLIVANVDRESTMKEQFLQALMSDDGVVKHTVVEVSATVNNLNDSSQEVRINIQETHFSEYGEKLHVKQIHDETVFHTIFNEILVEVKRREAMS